MIGKELIRIAGAVDGCASDVENAESLAGGAVELAAELALGLFL
jgi:hypothetical protein